MIGHQNARARRRDLCEFRCRAVERNPHHLEVEVKKLPRLMRGKARVAGTDAVNAQYIFERAEEKRHQPSIGFHELR